MWHDPFSYVWLEHLNLPSSGMDFIARSWESLNTLSSLYDLLRGCCWLRNFSDEGRSALVLGFQWSFFTRLLHLRHNDGVLLAFLCVDSVEVVVVHSGWIIYHWLSRGHRSSDRPHGWNSELNRILAIRLFIKRILCFPTGIISKTFSRFYSCISSNVESLRCSPAMIPVRMHAITVQAYIRIMGFSSMKRPTMNGGAIPPEPAKTVDTDIILFDSAIYSTCIPQSDT